MEPANYTTMASVQATLSQCRQLAAILAAAQANSSISPDDQQVSAAAAEISTDVSNLEAVLAGLEHHVLSGAQVAQSTILKSFGAAAKPPPREATVRKLNAAVQQLKTDVQGELSRHRDGCCESVRRLVQEKVAHGVAAGLNESALRAGLLAQLSQEPRLRAAARSSSEPGSKSFPLLLAMMKDAAGGVEYRGRRQPKRQVDVLGVITEALVGQLVPGESVLAGGGAAGEGEEKGKKGRKKGAVVAVEEAPAAQQALPAEVAALVARDFVAPGLAATVARRQAFSAVLSANMSWLAKEGGKRGGNMRGFDSSCGAALKAAGKASSGAVVRALRGQARALVRSHMESAMREACEEALEVMQQGEGRSVAAGLAALAASLARSAATMGLARLLAAGCTEALVAACSDAMQASIASCGARCERLDACWREAAAPNGDWDLHERLGGLIGGAAVVEGK